ncbi:MAG: hypothetical protein ACREBU_10325, partial [Nitrososphaera sp.]
SQTTVKNDLPVYIINQLNSQKKKTKTTLAPTEQKEALNLLFQLGEINQIEYEEKLKEITGNAQKGGSTTF